MRFFSILLLIAVFFTNCTKDNTTTLENTNTQNNEYTLPDFRLENGIVYFSSISDAQKAYNVIDKRFNESTDPNILKLIEIELGHSSLLFTKSNSIASLRDEEEYSKEEILAIEAADFIGDDIRKILLNSDYEIGIGNDVYVFFDKDREYIIKDSHTETVEAFRTKEKGKKEIPHDVISTHVELKTSEVTHFVIEHKIPKEDEDGDETAEERDEFNTIRTSVDVSSIPCVLFGKAISASVTLKVTDDNDTPGDLTDDETTTSDLMCSFTFNMGDNSPLMTFTDVLAVNFDYIYPGSGTFTLTCDVVPTEPLALDDAILTAERDVIVANAVCAEDDIHDFEWQEDSFQAFLSVISFKRDFWGSHAGAGSGGWRKLPNGQFTKDYNGQVNVSIDAVFLDSDCSNPDTKDESEDCNSCHKKQTWVTKLFGKRSIENGDIQSSHSVSFGNGSTFTSDLVLNPC